MNRVITQRLAYLDPSTLDAVEISGWFHGGHPWKSYRVLDFADFDLCDPPQDIPQFDVVLCEQVLEHVPDPWRAVRTLHDLTRPGGYVVVSTPFLYRVHFAPGDYWRFTRDGMALLLQSAGLRVVSLESWGNRWAARALLRGDPPISFWRPLYDEPLLPVMVWAVARRPQCTGQEPAVRESNAP